MSNIAIRIENLGKRYKIGVKREKYYTLRDSLMKALTYPFRRPAARTATDHSQAPGGIFLGPQRCVPGNQPRGHYRHHRAERRRQIHPAENPLPHHRAHQGRAELFGRVGSLLEVGTGFHPELTGRENIFLNGVIMGMTRAEIQRNFDEIVAFAEIEKFLDTPVKHYSSGMYVRLAFAVAAHLDPEILLVDEVLAVGDAAFQKKCLGKMEEVAKGGRTVLFVSHNMGAIRSLCQKSALFEEGKLQGYSDNDEIIERYNKSLTLSTAGGSNRNIKRPDNNCTGRVVIKNATVIPPNNWRDYLLITFHYQLRDVIEKFSVEWFIRDIYGTRVLSGLSPFVEQTWFYPQRTEEGEIKCIMHEWRLPGGIYTLCASLTIPFIERFDYVEDLVSFIVPDMYPGKPGFTFSPAYGYFLPEVSWEADKNTKIII